MDGKRKLLENEVFFLKLGLRGQILLGRHDLTHAEVAVLDIRSGVLEEERASLASVVRDVLILTRGEAFLPFR